MPTGPRGIEANDGYDKNWIIPKPGYKFRFSTWETFRNPCSKNDDILSQIFKQNENL